MTCHLEITRANLGPSNWVLMAFKYEPPQQFFLLTNKLQLMYFEVRLLSASINLHCSFHQKHPLLVPSGPMHLLGATAVLLVQWVCINYTISYYIFSSLNTGEILQPFSLHTNLTAFFFSTKSYQVFPTSFSMSVGIFRVNVRPLVSWL